MQSPGGNEVRSEEQNETQGSFLEEQARAQKVVQVSEATCNALAGSALSRKSAAYGSFLFQGCWVTVAGVI